MTKILKFYFRHKKLCLAAIFFIAAAAVFIFPHTAFAAEDPEDTGSIINSINEIFNHLLRMSSMWLWPVLLMTGSLLDNDLIFGGAMGERLLEIWVQIRNLVNIVFVLILLAIAVYNVLGLGEEGGGLPLAFKTAIPKFVLALLAVNFSFLAVKVVLDFTNVITGAVFALPTNAITQEKQDFTSEFEKTICGVNSDEMPLKPLYCEGPKFNAKAQSFFSRLDRSNITLVYALRFGKAINLKFVRDDIKGITQLGFNVIFNSILYIVYAVSFIVLFLVLLLRIVSLWVIVVLSPLIALGIVLPNLKELAGEGSSLQEKFLNDAIAPIKIGLVLSISYIMLSGFEADKSIHGEILASSNLSSLDMNAIPTGILDLQQLMIAVAMVVIIWVGVFSAAEKSTAKGLTGWIKGHLESAGKFLSTLPAYLQIIPVGGKRKGEKMSLPQILGTLKQPFVDVYKKGRYMEPGTEGGDDLHTLGKKGDLNSFMSQFKSTPGGLATPQGLNGLIELAQQKGQDKLVKKLKDIKDPKDTKAITEAIYSTSGEVTDAFKRIGGREEVRTMIDKGQASGAGASEPAGPTKQKVVEGLVGSVSAKDLAGRPSFKGWTEQEVQKLKDDVGKIQDEDERVKVIVIEGGVVNKDKTKKAVDDFIRTHSQSQPPASQVPAQSVVTPGQGLQSPPQPAPTSTPTPIPVAGGGAAGGAAAGAGAAGAGTPAGGGGGPGPAAPAGGGPAAAGIP